VPPAAQLPGAGGGTADFLGLEEYVALMRRCWAEEPEERPQFGAVVKELR
jgi:hypothetical protein